MDSKLTWLILFFCLILQVSCDHHLSKQDVALLTDEDSPKCFTRNLEDLICFWEALEGKSHEFFYQTEDGEGRCNVSKQESEEGRILHVCVFPPSDVFLFTSTDLRVVDIHTNKTIYSRTIDVSKQLLLDPPSNTSLHLTGEVGQLLIRWQAPTIFADLQYEIHYASKTFQDTAIVVKGSRHEHKLLSLHPGEMYKVQLRLKPSGSSLKGHWSDWSSSVTAMVPQPAENIELQCHTPDLCEVHCRWNEELYGYGNYSLYYRQKSRGTWGNWSICNTNSTMQCILNGDEISMFEVYIIAELKPLNRTFYMDMFRMNNSIKTKAPDGLKQSDGERHCLIWNSPLHPISQHLIYQLRYQLHGEREWKLFTVQSPKTNTCLEVQVGSQYTIQVKAMPNGSFYSGHWSAWSKGLVIKLPSNSGMLFIACVPFVLLIISIMLLSFFSRYVSKLKQFLWPPVPNLNEVLESFLKDINGQHWEPNFSIKLCDEDIPASVVEFMSEGDTQVTRKPSNYPNFPQPGCLAGDSNGEYTVEGLELNREYVTLNSCEILPCLTGNDYVYKVDSSSVQAGEKLCCCSSICYTTSSTSTTDILNHSYVQTGHGGNPAGLVEIPAHHYTNLEHTATAKGEE